MSFRFKNKTVTLNNYKQIFENCSPDIQDEIRSAVLDDTQISRFIEPCGEDSYKLGQIRMAIRELVPPEYVVPAMSGRTIYLIRRGFSSGIDMSQILRYVNNNGITVDPSILEKLTEFVLVGTNISNVDFTTVQASLVDTICRGLYRGYPMWLLIEDGVKMSEHKMSILMRGMALGIDVHVFLSNDWQDDVMLLIFSYAKTVDINSVLRYINPKFDLDIVRELLDLASHGVDVSRLAARDEDGYPIYNRFQVYAIGQAILDGTVTEAMYNPSLSDLEITKIHDDILAKK